ncbi:MAG: hypothetical protein OXG37_01545 [Actinomycetia bacterium]|nr:hypothetical protein [Actinomycetes bacterium]
MLCVTDHVLCPDDPSLNAAVSSLWAVDELRHAAYIDAIAAAADRAIVQYGMVVMPGFELTINLLDPTLALHAVAGGCRSSSRLRMARPRPWPTHGPTARRSTLRTRRRLNSLDGRTAASACI